MSREVKETKNKQKQNMVGIAILATAIGKAGELLDEMTKGESIHEFALHEAELTISLEDNGIDKDGNRFDQKTGKLLGIKGKISIPERTKKEWEAKGLLKNQEEMEK